MKLWILPCTCARSRHATATKTAADFIFLLILHRLLLRRFWWWFSSRALEHEAVNEWACLLLFLYAQISLKKRYFPIPLPLTEPHSLSASSENSFLISWKRLALYSAVTKAKCHFISTVWKRICSFITHTNEKCLQSNKKELTQEEFKWTLMD